MFSTSKHITVSPYPNLPYIDGVPTQSMDYHIGTVRYNGTHRALEAYDGYSWRIISNPNTTVGLSAEAEEAMEWAIKKMHEERQIQELAEKYPAIKDAKEKLDILLTLIK